MQNKFFGISKQASNQIRHSARNPHIQAARHTRLLQQRWPPADSSPLHPIEPWGKQFFIFNGWALRDANFSEFGKKPCPPLKRDGSGNPILGETTMCTTNSSRVPLLFLSRQDFEELAVRITEIKRELGRFRELLCQAPLDKTPKLQSLLLPEKQRGRQRQQGNANQDSCPVRAARFRRIKRTTKTTVLWPRPKIDLTFTSSNRIIPISSSQDGMGAN